MRVVVISKIPFLKLCREFFRLEYGIIDFDNFLDCFCSGIEGKAKDRDHIWNMVYGDAWNNGHHEPYNEQQRLQLFRFLNNLRSCILNAIHGGGIISYHLHVRYQSQFTSRISLTFEVFK